MPVQQNKTLMGDGVKNGEVKNTEVPPRSKSGLMKLSSYVLALRPWSLSASLMPTLLGSTIAYKYPGASDFNYITLIFTIFTIVSVHGAGNVVNTYFDYVKGNRQFVIVLFHY